MPTPDDLQDQYEDHDRGLAFDLSTLLGRRSGLERRGALKLLGGFGLVALAGCAASGSSGSASSQSTSTTSGTGSGTSGASAATDIADATCVAIPEETAGPFPGDGTNRPNALTESGIVRSDLTKSFGSASGTADGIPTTVKLVVSDSANACAPLTDAAVYIWHCTRDGEYSMYGRGITEENYLRGVQTTDADGAVTFTTIFPAAYSGRWPHMHFEVYPDLAAATSAGDPVLTSQLALPRDACDLAYATTGYEQSVTQLARSSLDTDMVFGDDSAAQQLATVTGDASKGFSVNLSLAV